MAGDWIKMRTSLLTNPKVNGIARELETSSEVSQVLSTGFKGGMNEIVTRGVMRHVTVSSLLVIWGAANEHTRDGEFANADLSDIDDMVGIPGFGSAMQSVGWLVFDEGRHTVTMPNFSEYNTSGSERAAGAKTSAQRQKEYRERKKALAETQSDVTGDVTRDVTNDVTRNRREEKRREEKKDIDTDAFESFWSEYPNRKAKASAVKAWEKIDPALYETIMNALRVQARSVSWLKDGGQFVPHAATWLNGKRWEDSAETPAKRADVSWLTATGFDTVEEARNFGCHPSTAHLFRDGRRIEEHA